MDEESVSFLSNGNELGERSYHSDDRFVTFAFAEGSMELRLGSRCFSHHIGMNADQGTYGAVVVDSRRSIDPCWTML